MIVAHCAPARVRLALFRTGFRLEPEKCPSMDTWQFLKGIYCSWVSRFPGNSDINRGFNGRKLKRSDSRLFGIRFSEKWDLCNS
ncbi:hypothetical protein MRB53_017532 [Persea americana]|uniref:Uncharacterized protein n=1 Tax=Persea americana TaxID=3435 RepID=A0ACC2M5D7_PERAE|nr:hypothetical protein MRB53_017532 [Persea americana]